MADETKSIEVTLGDGTKVVGKDYEEALKNAISIADNKATYINTLKTEKQTAETELATLRAQEQARSAAAQKAKKADGGFDKDEYYRMLNDDPIMAQNYLDAHRLGIDDPNQVAPTLQSWGQKVTNLEKQAIAADFYNRHSGEFPMDMNAAKLMDEQIGSLMAQGFPLSPITLDTAYNSLVAEGKITPVKKTDKEEETPNPSLGGNSGSTDAIDDSEMAKLAQMSTADLEKYMRSKGLFQ